MCSGFMSRFSISEKEKIEILGISGSPELQQRNPTSFAQLISVKWSFENPRLSLKEVSMSNLLDLRFGLEL